MKEIKENFQDFCRANPNLSTLMCYNRFIWSTPKLKWDRRKVIKYFGVLVDKEDYRSAEKASYLKWLLESNNMA